MKGDFWHGPDAVDRRVAYAKDMTPEIQANGDETDRRIRAVYIHYAAIHSGEPNFRYSSGWRPKAVNEATKNSAKRSTHMDGNAGDVVCDDDGHFAWWCHKNNAILEQHGLWMEHPVATVVRAKRDGMQPWCHLQRVPPGSGLRCYWPDGKSIAEWQTYYGDPNEKGTTKEIVNA